jgi:hypothetical protein
MTPDEREDFEERAALVWEGAPSRAPISMQEAERVARQCLEAARRLPLTREPVRTT